MNAQCSPSVLRTEMAMLQKMMCKLNLHHHWHVESAEDGSGRYRRCTRCGKYDRDWDGSGFMH